MAGFLVAWTSDGGMPDARAWAQAERSASRTGGNLSSHLAAPWAVLAWHRGSGEFPHSGKIFPVKGKHVVWLGQCVDDAGEASSQAMGFLAQEVWSDTAIANCNGPFAAVVVGSDPCSVRVVTDRYRHYPIYLYKGARVTVASTDMHCLLPFMSERALNYSAVDMLLRCGELIDRDTLLDGVELLPPGTVLTVGSSAQGKMQATEHRYWAMRHDGSAAASLACTADELAQRLTSAVRRLEAVSPRLGITLSGGLDSRIILDLCHRPERVPSFTWGLPDCRDIVCASRFAQVVRSPHTVEHWEPDAFPLLWNEGVSLTAGAFGIESMHMLPFVPLLASKCDVVLNGLAGDVILGGNFLKYEWLTEKSIANLARAVWRWRVSEREDSLVDQLMILSTNAPKAEQQWVDSMSSRAGARPVERVNDWLYENRIFRYTNSGSQLLRNAVESHAPFWDRDFIDAVTRVKQEHKFKHRLYLEVMRRVAPRAASVTWQRTNIPPAWGFYANFAAMGMHRVIGKLARPFGIDPFNALKVADPAAWMRGPWRAAVQELLLGSDAQRHGLWNAQAAENLWHAHLAGANHTRQLGAMVAVVLFARQVLDEEVI